MTAYPRLYKTYNWFKKKGIKIEVLDQGYYPLNYIINTRTRKYYIILKEWNTSRRIKIDEQIVGQEIFLLVYDRFRRENYLIPSFHYFINSSRNGIYISEKIRRRFLIYPGRKFAYRSAKTSSAVLIDPYNLVLNLDQSQLSLLEWL